MANNAKALYGNIINGLWENKSYNVSVLHLKLKLMTYC